MLRWRLSFLGSLGLAMNFLSPVRMFFCPTSPPLFLSSQKQLFSCAFIGTVLALRVAYKKLWDESEPGFSIRYILHSFTEHLLDLSVCARARHPALNKILPVPALGLLQPRMETPGDTQPAVTSAVASSWPVTYSGGLVSWCSVFPSHSPDPDIYLGSLALLP